jgi:hypothetical protein
MTRKNFVAIAQIIKDNATTVEKQNGTIAHVLPYDKTVIALASYFVTENPNFDVTRFNQACGIIE